MDGRRRNGLYARNAVDGLGRPLCDGRCFGAMLLVLVGTGLVVFGVNQYWYQVGLGVVLLLSVLIGQARSRYTMNRSIQ